MKKFLSLVLSLVMTMSLVTIGAGATEYKNLTDKSEIQYEEAVAVLNKLGIVTGYEDGTFKPTGALTRGAAAKIIVSLMIGSDAAAALTVAGAPYKDVPVTNTFAAVISYCKTAGYINGYSDGTFRPTASLTGFAFAKMLLGAIGYRGDVEGFTGSGWTMNVAKLGSTAGLFDDFKVTFAGNDGVTREAACLLALNTLKATEVEYTANGNNIVVGDKGTITGATTNYNRSYVTSRNDNINANISSEKSGNDSNYLTLEFGEEHFSDLKLRDDVDDYGRPSNTWSLKNVKIGTYAKGADFKFTEGIGSSTDSDATLESKLGMKSYKLAKNVEVTVNGKTNQALSSVADIARTYTGNGTTVQVYLNDKTADQIDYVAVIKTQPMEINKVTSSSVTLDQLDLNVKNGDSTKTGVKVQSVESTDDCYAALKDLKADDIVIVTPLTTDDSTYDVDAVYVPTTATGKISAVKLNNSGLPNGLTVAGVDYKTSAQWTVEDGRYNLDKTSVSTTVDTTVYIDAFGYVIYAKDVKASSDFILFDETYANTVNGKIVYMAQGWDMNGNALSLNIGTKNQSLVEGAVYQYDEATNNSSADYTLKAVGDVSTERLAQVKLANFSAINAGQSGYTFGTNITTATVGAGNYFGKDASYATKTVYYDKSVKFVFITRDSDGIDVTGVTVKDGVQAITSPANVTFVMNKDKNKITTVIVDSDKDVEISSNLMYVTKIEKSIKNTAGDTVSLVTAYLNGDKTEGIELDKQASANTFYTYSKNDTTGVYKVNVYNPSLGRSQFTLPNTNIAGSTTSVVLRTNEIEAKNYVANLYINGVKTAVKTTLGATDMLNFSGATFVDLIDMNQNVHEQFSSLGDMLDYAADKGYVQDFTIAIQYNTSTANNAQTNRVAYVYVLAVNATTTPVNAADYHALAAVTGVQYSIDNGSTWAASYTSVKKDTIVKIKVDAAATGVATVPAQTLTTVGGGVYSFVMPNVNITNVTFTVPGIYAGKSEVNVTVPATCTMLYKGTAPTVAEQAVLLRGAVEAAGYTFDSLDQANATSVIIKAHQTIGGMALSPVTFELKAGDVKAGVDITLNDTPKFVAATTKYSDIMAGKFVYVNGAATPVPVDTTVVADNAAYVDGYYSVTLPTTTAAIVGVTYTVTDSAAVQYAKKDATINITITASGTATGITAATLTATNGTIAATAGNLPGTTVADIAVTNPTTTTVLFTPANGAVTSATSICTVTLTVGMDNVTFTFA